MDAIFPNLVEILVYWTGLPAATEPVYCCSCSFLYGFSAMIR